MKSCKLLASLFILTFMLFSSSLAYSYGYGTAGEDPLITMFKRIVTEAKKSDKNWDTISKIISEYKEPISNMDKFFKIDLYLKFEKSITNKDVQMLISATVNLIYLSMMEKFELIKRNGFKDYDFAKGRLALNDKYYRDIFKGNVVKYDKRNGTGYNDEILKLLLDIQGTIGKPEKFGMGGEPAHPDDYDRMYNTIKSNLIKVFPYFEG